MKKFAMAVALTMMASLALAQGRGNGRPMGPGGPAGPKPPMGGGLIVGADGTLFVTQRAEDDTEERSEVITAISPAGATLWTKSLDSARLLVLSGSNLIAVSSERPAQGEDASSTLTAINTTSGATAWTLEIDGHAGVVKPYSGGIYVIAASRPATQGEPPVRKLMAVSNAGAVVWTVNL